jgi:hypothetical protein
MSFASADGEHGYGVRRAVWTPDSRYFVFDLASSGGHSPETAPIYLFDRMSGRLAELPLPKNTLPAAFELRPHNRLSVEVWDVEKQAPSEITVSLHR